jgi:penicillin-insensitive murein endopeptidase
MAAAWRTFVLLLFLGIAPHAQDPGTLNPEPLPLLQDPSSPKIPARELFARKTAPLPGSPQSIGSYADGCLVGAIALPTTGPSWQVIA